MIFTIIYDGTLYFDFNEYHLASMVSRGVALFDLSGLLLLSEKFIHQDLVKCEGYFSVYINVSFKEHLIYTCIFLG